MKSAAVISLALVSGALVLFGSRSRLAGSAGFSFAGLVFPQAPIARGGALTSLTRPLTPMQEVNTRVAQAEAALGRPLVKTSWLRSAAENLRVGGAPNSQHLTGAAVDISTAGHDRAAVFRALSGAGFTGFGFYKTHIHADIGPSRVWFGSAEARRLWGSN